MILNEYDSWLIYMCIWLSNYEVEEVQIIYNAFFLNTFVIVLNNIYFPCNNNL